MRACWSLTQEMLGVNQSRAARTRALSVSREPGAWRGEWEETTERAGIAKRITQTRACFTVSLARGFRFNCVRPRCKARKLRHRRGRVEIVWRRQRCARRWPRQLDWGDCP